MPNHQFEDLEVWKRAARVAVEIFNLVEPFKLFALKDQMARSAISIPSNIAEGAERDSDKEFVRFLRIAKGSAAELRTQLYLAARANIIPTETSNILTTELKQIGSMLQGLIRSISPA
ncbi:MAG: four helix bundle protein [Verrucomicrobiaceae bacterium]|nr:four helix bundle protein [Verrucomicrobiaceae bacterium]